MATTGRLFSLTFQYLIRVGVSLNADVEPCVCVKVVLDDELDIDVHIPRSNLLLQEWLDSELYVQCRLSVNFLVN